MELGNFSVSLAVKDIEASKFFYERLGFAVFMGDQSQNWLIMKNGAHAIGLFQGMFDKNILTFNPGWNSDAQPLREFADVSRVAAPAQSEWRKHDLGSRRKLFGPGQLYDCRSGREHDSGRSARIGSAAAGAAGRTT
jgi:hypothetical protein